MSELGFSIERTVSIRAERELVFRYFTDSARFAAWWGAGSEIDGRPGGRYAIRHPNGVVSSGEIRELEAGRRIVLSYGYEGENPLIPPGGSLLTILLEDAPEGTRVRLRHDLPDAKSRDEHVQGWRYQLAVFANVVSAEAHRAVAERVDALLEAWSEPDPERRRRLLEENAVPELAFQDAFSCTVGLEDLHVHLAAAQVHMPGLKLVRDGDVQQCQGTAVARWTVRDAAGSAKRRGLNVVELAPDGRIARVVGLWEA
jgi:uncharacterized protein YndB with AHSA1/START domain